MSLLPVEPAYRLAERGEEHRWLVTGLWSEQAVGIVGGEPKCCKSFLALDLAVSVASPKRLPKLAGALKNGDSLTATGTRTLWLIRETNSR